MVKSKIKFFKYVGLTLLLCSLLGCWKFVKNKEVNKKETEKIISENFYNSYAKVDNITYNPIQNDIDLTNDYVGYVELADYNIKRLIISTTDKIQLDKGFVGILKGSANLDDEYGNIILAGHSIINVFQNLHYTKVGDTIKLVSHLKEYNFTIVEKHIIADDDFSYFKQSDNQKILTLVTCENNNKKRLVVIAKLQD